MARVTPQEYAEKWGRRTRGATQDYQAGVRRVTEAPGVRAAAQADRMVTGVQRAVQEGKWQDRVAAVTLQEWQQAAINKGAPRISQGVEEALPRQVAFAQDLLQYEDGLVARINAEMPRGDLEQNINRSIAFQRGMASYRRPAR